MASPTPQEFQRLLEFRVNLRRFQRWSEDQAKAAGLTHVQHQLLVAIKGHPGQASPTVGDLAGYLLLGPHSTVGLVDRTEAAGLVRRIPDRDDGQVVRVRLTEGGDRIVRTLTRAHLDRLQELAVILDELVTRHGADGAAHPGATRVRFHDGRGGLGAACGQDRGRVVPRSRRGYPPREDPQHQEVSASVLGWRCRD